MVVSFPSWQEVPHQMMIHHPLALAFLKNKNNIKNGIKGILSPFILSLSAWRIEGDLKRGKKFIMS